MLKRCITARDKQEAKTAKASLQNGFGFHFRVLTHTNICSTTRGRPRAARRASRQLVVTEFYLPNTFLKPQGYSSKTKLDMTVFSHSPKNASSGIVKDVSVCCGDTSIHPDCRVNAQMMLLFSPTGQQ